MPEENIENIAKSGSNFAPTFANHHPLKDVNFNGHYLGKNIFVFEADMNSWYKSIIHLENWGLKISGERSIWSSLHISRRTDLTSI